ncbi:MAG: hypothetical protein HY812_02425 [Planctomycetes bacterium]|nr:hypothetical protein [Planctomycetota bacterium]
MIGGLAFVNPAPGAGYIVQVALNLTTLFGSPSSIAIFEGESVTLYVADDPTQCGAPLTWQYWTGSVDERNLCSSYSFLWSQGTGYVFAFVPWFEWAIGLGSIDATMTTVVQHDPAFDVGLYDAHSPTAGFSPGFDQGSGSQTLSLAGPAGLGDFLGFAVYDDPNFYGGTGRLACGNIWGYDLTAAGTCVNRASNPSFIFFPTGGPGGPVLSGIWPQMPRCVGKIDTLFTALLANSIWVMSTNHSTAPGAMNIPWWPGSFGQNSGSNASGLSGGFPIPVPQLPVLIGLDLFFWDWATDGSNSFLDHNQNKGHALSNGYYVLFFP